jgi:hypothetical protein
VTTKDKFGVGSTRDAVRMSSLSESRRSATNSCSAKTLGQFDYAGWSDWRAVTISSISGVWSSG